MNNLNDLLCALVMVIVKYLQPIPQASESVETDWTNIQLPFDEDKLVKDLLEKDAKALRVSLSSMIEEGTQVKTGRKALLNDLLHLVELLKDYMQTEDSYTQENSEDEKSLESALVDFLVDLKHMCGFEYANSRMAECIRELITKPLNITKTTDKTFFHHQISSLFLQYKNALISEKNLALQKEVQALLKQQMQTQTKNIHYNREIIEQHKSLTDEMERENHQLQTEIEALKNENASLKSLLEQKKKPHVQATIPIEHPVKQTFVPQPQQLRVRQYSGQSRFLFGTLFSPDMTGSLLSPVAQDKAETDHAKNL